MNSETYECYECGAKTDDPHTSEAGEDVCEDCCEECEETEDR